MQKSDTECFYEHLSPATSFDACMDDAAYTPFPADWTLLVSDVRDSTRAIADGHYKVVNMVGAATITAILNACDGKDLPFVFGGDGGTVIVPPSLRSPSELALRELKSQCQAMFGLDLRVGAFAIAELQASGHPLSVCKYQLSPGNHLGFLSGAGHAHATDQLKSGNTGIGLDRTASASLDLSGLTCRWEPLESRRGCILTLAIAPRFTSAGTPLLPPSEITSAITHILDGDMGGAAPASTENLRLKWPPQGLWLEATARSGTGRRTLAIAYALASSFAQLIAERLQLRIGPYDATTYRAEMAANTDYRKLDGVMRLVLDVTPAQADAIESYLAARHREHAVAYGCHRASSALMTCLVNSLRDGRHVHFIDGADGGHTLAALDLKRRASESGYHDEPSPPGH
jgi:hypothetical protein